MKFQKIRGKTHYVFEEKYEFENYFMGKIGTVPKLIENWREAGEGDWVIADDGGIVQVLKKFKARHPHDRPNYSAHNGMVRTVVGTFIQADKYEMDTDFTLHESRYRISGAGEARINYRWNTREDLTKKELIFVAELCSGKTLQKAYESAFGPKYNWIEKATALLKRDRVMNKINETLRDTMESKGLGIDFILDRLKDLAIGAQSDAVKLSALKEIGEYYGAKEKVKEITTGRMMIQSPFSEHDIAMIEAEEVKVLSEGETD